ncbi:MAG: hypothetical protein ACREF0_13365, partial [Acetobacteraceae bacterium]
LARRRHRLPRPLVHPGFGKRRSLIALTEIELVTPEDEREAFFLFCARGSGLTRFVTEIAP